MPYTEIIWENTKKLDRLINLKFVTKHVTKKQNQKKKNFE